MSEEILEFDAEHRNSENLFVVTAPFHTHNLNNETSRFNQQSNRPDSRQLLTVGFDPVDDYTEDPEKISRYYSFGRANTDHLLQRLTDSADGTSFARIDLNANDDNEDDN